MYRRMYIPVAALSVVFSIAMPLRLITPSRVPIQFRGNSHSIIRFPNAFSFRAPET